MLDAATCFHAASLRGSRQVFAQDQIYSIYINNNLQVNKEMDSSKEAKTSARAGQETQQSQTNGSEREKVAVRQTIGTYYPFLCENPR